MIYSTPLLCWAKSVHAKAYASFRTAEIGNTYVWMVNGSVLFRLA